jgi:hypothetical protein
MIVHQILMVCGKDSTPHLVAVTANQKINLNYRYYNSCVFEAGTRNVYQTKIGSTDVGDVTREAINLLGVSSSIYSRHLTMWSLTYIE